MRKVNMSSDCKETLKTQACTIQKPEYLGALSVVSGPNRHCHNGLKKPQRSSLLVNPKERDLWLHLSPIPTL